jgi:hypothetical protein
MSTKLAFCVIILLGIVVLFFYTAMALDLSPLLCSFLLFLMLPLYPKRFHPLSFKIVVIDLYMAGMSIKLYNSPLTLQNAYIGAAIFTFFLSQGVFIAIDPHRSANHQHIRYKSLYNLDHGRLNLELPSSSMWMNMGYWQNTKDFPTACKALLQQVLNYAGHNEPAAPSLATGSLPPYPSKEWSLIDLGFGCGDQTAYINGNFPSLQHYIGITIDARQFQYADRRLDSLDLSNEQIHLFCADASSPSTWSEELTKAVEHWKTNTSGDKWVLALDTLYHFSPSRWGILTYASKELGASLMAFDLILAPGVPLAQRLLLRVLTKLMGAPWANFVREDEYRSKLKTCGYENVEIRDVSEHVFGPLANFLYKRDRQLKDIGLGLGKFRAAAWLFQWWATSGIIRGCIVVAKKPAAEKVVG